MREHDSERRFALNLRRIPMKKMPVLPAHLLALLAILVAASSTPLHAQTFAQIPPLAFTKPFGGPNPLPQVLGIESTGTALSFSATATTSTGGNWLQVSNGSGTTPEAITLSITADVSLAAGTYNGTLTIKEYFKGVIKMIVPVTLTVAPTGGTFFDNMPGQFTFSLKTGGQPPSQIMQIRNGGSGTLAWTLTGTTADGGNWLTASSLSGTAPSIISIGITPASLPSGSGTYIGQLLFQTTGDSVTVPVSVTVGDPVFEQVNPIAFTMPFGGANPLPQVLSIASTSSAISFAATAATGQGGNWLKVSNGSGTANEALTVSVINASTLPAGTYTGEVIVTEYFKRSQAVTVPVTLTIEPASAAFFDSVPGQLAFSLKTSGLTPPAQIMQIRNGGSGTLNWAAATSTADGGAWLKASLLSGTAPSNVSVSITPSMLPGGGALAGTYVGQVVFQTTGDSVTVPVSVTVGASVFEQANPMNFTMPFGGANPLPQILNLASTGSAISFAATAATAQGGNWLQVSNGSGTTNAALTISVINASTLPAGTYTGEVIITEYFNRSQAMTVPVTLTIEPASAAFFDSVPGQMAFSLKTSGHAPPSQTVQIRNGGAGSLKWTLTTSTADGDDWLIASPLAGTAPSTVTVGINPADLPGNGILAGTYVGQLLFQSGTDIVTIPVSVTVGDSVFEQVNPMNFTMPFGGANPLPQILDVISTNSAISFADAAATSQGGNWLQVSNGSGTTPSALTIGVVNASTLPAGTYTGEVIITEYFNRSQAMTVPVTLTILPATKAFFDNVPGLVSFSFKPTATDPPAQSVQIRNGGSGTLAWTLSTSTADNGKWLIPTLTKGTAPSTVGINIDNEALPGQGLIAGTFVGQLVFKTTGDIVTIPVSVTVGDPVFVQAAPFTFTTTRGVNPPPQTLNENSTGSAISFALQAASGQGGNWLHISNGSGTTPAATTVSVDASALAVGTYTGEILVTEYYNRRQAMAVPVTITVNP